MIWKYFPGENFRSCGDFWVSIMQQGGRIKQASFEDSDFKGDGIFVDSLRWWRQLLALLEKNIKTWG